MKTIIISHVLVSLFNLFQWRFIYFQFISNGIYTIKSKGTTSLKLNEIIYGAHPKHEGKLYLQCRIEKPDDEVELLVLQHNLVLLHVTAQLLAHGQAGVLQKK